MNISDALALNPGLSNQLETRHSLANSSDTHSAMSASGHRDPDGGTGRSETSDSFRSTVERRFKRMSDAHDRIRSELLRIKPIDEIDL
jgi:hypothetical protein